MLKIRMFHVKQLNPKSRKGTDKMTTIATSAHRTENKTNMAAQVRTRRNKTLEDAKRAADMFLPESMLRTAMLADIAPRQTFTPITDIKTGKYIVRATEEKSRRIRTYQTDTITEAKDTAIIDFVGHNKVKTHYVIAERNTEVYGGCIIIAISTAEAGKPAKHYDPTDRKWGKSWQEMTLF